MDKTRPSKNKIMIKKIEKPIKQVTELLDVNNRMVDKINEIVELLNKHDCVKNGQIYYCDKAKRIKR